MARRSLGLGLILLAVAASWTLGHCLYAQQAPGELATQGALAEPPPVPQGIEVMARGPVHEAYATLTADPTPTQRVPKEPPKALDEMPPEEKPAGDAVWIGGYWAWDEDRNDYLWVSGIWRTLPPGKVWVAGYWRQDTDQYQWVPGFWSQAPKENAPQQVSYLAAPPAPPQTAPPGQPPTVDSFYVPGTWVWNDTAYAWRAGYWARVQPGYVWVPAHYIWTPGGYVFVAGYWDLALDRRGVLYAPVYVDRARFGATFVYTPGYVVQDTLVVDAFFVRPCYYHYYFGDYYGPAYRDRGFESCVIYSRGHYDSIWVYERWHHRDDPHWEAARVDICLARHAGRAPMPGRAEILFPASRLAAVKGIRTERLNPAARMEVREHARVVREASFQRTQAERMGPAGPNAQPRVATLHMPPAAPANHGPVTGGPHPGFSAAQDQHSAAPSYRPNTQPPAGQQHGPGAPAGGGAPGMAVNGSHPPQKPGAQPSHGGQQPGKPGPAQPGKTPPAPPAKTPPQQPAGSSPPAGTASPAGGPASSPGSAPASGNGFLSH